MMNSLKKTDRRLNKLKRRRTRINNNLCCYDSPYCIDCNLDHIVIESLTRAIERIEQLKNKRILKAL